MIHPVLRALLAEWHRLKGPHPAPERALVSPASIAGALADTVMIAFAPAGGHPIRLAGSRVCALFGRELRGERFTDLFEPAGHPAASALVAGVADAQAPAHAMLAGASAGHGDLDLELLLLPLRVEGQTHERLFGALVGSALPWWLARDPLRSLRIRSLRHLRDASDRCCPPLPAEPGAASPARHATL